MLSLCLAELVVVKPHLPLVVFLSERRKQRKQPVPDARPATLLVEPFADMFF
jgi:hypothetical protein